MVFFTWRKSKDIALKITTKKQLPNKETFRIEKMWIWLGLSVCVYAVIIEEYSDIETNPSVLDVASIIPLPYPHQKKFTQQRDYQILISIVLLLRFRWETSWVAPNPSTTTLSIGSLSNIISIRTLLMWCVRITISVSFSPSKFIKCIEPLHSWTRWTTE